MRILTLLALMALGAAAPGFAAEQDEHHAHAGMAMVINSECPMCGKMVGDKPATVPVTVGEGAGAKHFLIACESQACADMFLKDPEPVLRKTFGKEAAGPKTQYK